jgi:hypothetical protein
MMHRHLTYANVMATISVFLVLGGGAYAAFHLPKNSVRSKHIVNGQVKTPDIAADAVTRSRLRNGSEFLSGLTPVEVTTSPATSTSPQEATATCPPGTKILSANANLSGGKDGTSPNLISHVTTEVYTIGDDTAHVEAYESSPYTDTWFVFLDAICAKTG